jgi:D-3-phosphoglycerate dehydrogenase
MHAGTWDRSALLGSELKGRTLGIVGVGRIGSEVAQRAIAFGMDVIGYDPYVGDERFRALRIRRAPTIEALLPDADILTIHTPLTADHPLRRLSNVLLTPHLGASTAEAQRNVAVDVCEAVRDALLHGELTRSLNVATVSGTEWRELQPALLVSQRAAAIARALLLDQGISIIQRVRLRVSPDLIGAGSALLAAACAGILEGVIDDGRLNLINARTMAEARGIELSIGELPATDRTGSVDISLGGGVREIGVAAMAPPHGAARVTRIGAFHVDVTPRQTMIVLTNNDVPGVIGRVGTALGDAHVNIAEYHQARLAQGGEALAAISVDGVVAPELRERLLKLPDVRTATIVRFGGYTTTASA